MDGEILIVGAGAIGGTSAILLQEKGFRPVLLTRHPETKQKSGSQGLKLRGHAGEFVSHPKVILPADLEGEKYDIVLIATKATDLQEAAIQILPCLKPDSLVVSLQNGICTDTLASIVGEDRTVGCVVGFGATMTNYGEYDMTSGGEFIIGSTGNISLERLDDLGSIMHHIVPTRLSENIISDLYRNSSSIPASIHWGLYAE